MTEIERAALEQQSKDSSPVTVGADSLSSNEEKPKRRRRVTKSTPDKKFICKYERCGRSYSRAEHLSRHQLNHAPKQIYECDYPECKRTFVRQDLCIRHRERHTTHGSQLQRRDTFSQGIPGFTPLVAAPAKIEHSPTTSNHAYTFSPTSSIPTSESLRQEAKITLTSFKRSLSDGHQIASGLSEPVKSLSGGSIDTIFTHPAAHHAASHSDRSIKRSESSSSYGRSPSQPTSYSMTNHGSRHGSFGTTEGSVYQATHGSPTDYYKTSQMHQYPTASLSQTVHATPYNFAGPAGETDAFGSQQAYTPSILPQQTFSPTEVAPTSNFNLASAVSQSLASSSNFDGAGQDMTSYPHPIFGGDEYNNRSPFFMHDDFTAWLFNEGRTNQQSSSSFPPATAGMMPSYNDQIPLQHQAAQYATSATLVNTDIDTQQHPMDLQAILDSKPPVLCMSEEKRQALLRLMTNVFNERPHDAVKRRKEAVFEGDVNADDHILSLKRMHLYIGSYWYHHHAQLPILHKPTFSAEKAPDLLLLAILAIGAATLDKIHGQAFTDAAAEFANFVVWHVRWELHRDEDFRPPAKLWVFQALLLIEVYEKMYATRALHERGHIHHDATLTLMRRGSSLVGRSAYDSPPSVREDRAGRSPGQSSAVDVPSTNDAWNLWIRNEATRRVAFAAFVIDSIHATMFGHSAKMVAHEMRLPLPCDEALWSATSAAEVARVHSTLQNNGIKPIMFLDGLKKTLKGDRVLTNSFGRTVLMAGLLSVSWHMIQRDLQVTTLGSDNFGHPHKPWRTALLKAFDYWKRDFDEALEDSQGSSSISAGVSDKYFPRCRGVDDENIFESRTVLHHLAHMASHADVVDCQIYAGAKRILGRTITYRDYTIVKDRVEQWAHTARARDATFYALKFLAQVLILPENELRVGTGPNGILSMAFDDQNLYFARDDFLLNRPWVCYFATLVVWSYGFALEGPITPTPPEDAFSSPKSRDQDMRDYLIRVGGVDAPDDLAKVTGKNRCLGMLILLKESFMGTRWELTHEAAKLLDSCIQRLRGVFPAAPSSHGGSRGGSSGDLSRAGSGGGEASGFGTR